MFHKAIAAAIIVLQSSTGLWGQAPLASEKDGLARFSVAYTGRLFGYARVPESQREDDTSCVAFEKRRLSDFTQSMLVLADKDRNRILLGMGNNFSPDLSARTFEGPMTASTKDGGPKTFRESKERFQWDEEKRQWILDSEISHPTIPMDNVACYFRQAGYRAITLGKHDFWFGPERLQMLARLLARKSEPGEANESGPVQMLASNVTIATTNPDANPRLPDYLKHLKYEVLKDTELPAVVLPYLRQFRVKNTAGAGRPARICPASKPGNPDELNFDKCMPLIGAEAACLSSEARLKAVCGNRNLDLAKAFDFSKPGASITYLFKDAGAVLEAGKSYGLCTTQQKDQKDVVACKTFYVHAPFLQDIGQDTAPETFQKNPFALPTEWAYSEATEDRSAVAVFGVVDPGMQQHVGMVNSSWLNKDNSLQTRLEFLAPDQALNQLLQKCAEDLKCGKARKVLMAQMAHPLAVQLSGRFPGVFDLTISETDFEHDTGVEHLGRTIRDKDPESRKSGFLVTPRPALEPEGDGYLEPHVAVAEIKGRVSAGTAAWSLNNRIEVVEDSGGGALSVKDRGSEAAGRKRIYPNQFPAKDEPESLNAAVLATVTAMGDKSKPADNALYQSLALLTMQRHTAADIAIMQKRDLFGAAKIGRRQVAITSLQDALNQIFWKGDLIIRTHVKGAALKKILKRSKELDKQDQDGLSAELEKGRAMIAVGLLQDDDNYYVNGAQVDDATLYSVAVSDFLGLGDTGYPDLGDAMFQPQIADLKAKQFSLTSLVCREIAVQHFKKLKTEKDLSAYCEAPVEGTKYFDTSSRKPADTTNGMTLAKQYEDAFAFGKHSDPPLRKPTMQGAVQQRRLWSVKLENADFSYAANIIKDPIGARTNFAGVPVSQVTSSESSTFQVDYRVRALRDTSHLDWFALSEANYQRQVKRSTSGDFASSASQPLDMLGFEGGVNLHLLPDTRPSGLRLLLSTRWEQPLRPLDTTTINGIYEVETAQVRTMFAKAGFRQDFGDTWFEGGYRYGRAFDLLDAYNVGDANCYPAAFGFSSLSQPSKPDATPCFGTTGTPLPVQLITRTAWQSGLFLNFNIKFPLNAKKTLLFTLANQGTLFFQRPGDRSVDTRYQDILTPALQIPLFGKLSLQPKMDIFVYENKVNHLRFRSVSPALSLQYQFSWREGMAWKPAFLYGTAQGGK